MSIGKKIAKVVGFTASVLALTAVVTATTNTDTVEAASYGVYTATATPSYRNPSTGVVEDSGGEAQYALGQSMTESATEGSALVEVDSSGTTYTTIRLGLMNYISNVSFTVDGSSVSSSVTQTNSSSNTADYRFRVSSENSVIRCSMYVEPMHRDVVFFITLSNLRSGSGDFVTSIKTNTQSTSSQSSSSSSGGSSSSGSSGGSTSSSTSSSSGEGSTSSDAYSNAVSDNTSNNTSSESETSAENTEETESSDKAENKTKSAEDVFKEFIEKMNEVILKIAGISH